MYKGEKRVWLYPARKGCRAALNRSAAVSSNLFDSRERWKKTLLNNLLCISGMQDATWGKNSLLTRGKGYCQPASLRLFSFNQVCLLRILFVPDTQSGCLVCLYCTCNNLAISILLSSVKVVVYSDWFNFSALIHILRMFHTDLWQFKFTSFTGCVLFPLLNESVFAVKENNVADVLCKFKKMWYMAFWHCFMFSKW